MEKLEELIGLLPQKLSKSSRIVMLVALLLTGCFSETHNDTRENSHAIRTVLQNTEQGSSMYDYIQHVYPGIGSSFSYESVFHACQKQLEDQGRSETIVNYRTKVYMQREPRGIKSIERFSLYYDIIDDFIDGSESFKKKFLQRIHNQEFGLIYEQLKVYDDFVQEYSIHPRVAEFLQTYILSGIDIKTIIQKIKKILQSDPKVQDSLSPYIPPLYREQFLQLPENQRRILDELCESLFLTSKNSQIQGFVNPPNRVEMANILMDTYFSDSLLKNILGDPENINILQHPIALIIFLQGIKTGIQTDEVFAKLKTIYDKNTDIRYGSVYMQYISIYYALVFPDVSIARVKQAISDMKQLKIYMMQDPFFRDISSSSIQDRIQVHHYYGTKFMILAIEEMHGTCAIEDIVNRLSVTQAVLGDEKFEVLMNKHNQGIHALQEEKMYKLNILLYTVGTDEIKQLPDMRNHIRAAGLSIDQKNILLTEIITYIYDSDINEKTLMNQLSMILDLCEKNTWIFDYDQGAWEVVRGVLEDKHVYEVFANMMHIDATFNANTSVDSVYTQENLPYVLRYVFDLPSREDFLQDVAQEVTQYPHWESLLNFIQSSEYKDNPIKISLLPNDLVSIEYKLGEAKDFQITMWLLEYAKKHYSKSDNNTSVDWRQVVDNVSKILQEYITTIPDVLPRRNYFMFHFPDVRYSDTDYNGVFNEVPSLLQTYLSIPQDSVLDISEGQRNSPASPQELVEKVKIMFEQLVIIPLQEGGEPSTLTIFLGGHGSGDGTSFPGVNGPILMSNKLYEDLFSIPEQYPDIPEASQYIQYHLMACRSNNRFFPDDLSTVSLSSRETSSWSIRSKDRNNIQEHMLVFDKQIQDLPLPEGVDEGKAIAYIRYRYMMIIYALYTCSSPGRMLLNMGDDTYLLSHVDPNTVKLEYAFTS